MKKLETGIEAYLRKTLTVKNLLLLYSSGALLIILGVIARLIQLKTFGISSPSNWKDLSVKKSASKFTLCQSPSFWRVETNFKKVCELNNEIYYLKSATEHSIKEIFAREFVKKNLGIRAPDTELLYEKKGRVSYLGVSIQSEYYVASKAIEGFVEAANFTAKGMQIFYPEYYDNQQIQNNFIKHIGEHGIAKLAVAMTFFNDLHGRNWGYDKHGIVIIDVDHVPDDNISSFFSIITENLERLDSMGITLSLDHIYKMKSIYENMRHIPIPKIQDKQVGISNETYQNLIVAYIKACDIAIQKIEKDHPLTSYSAPSFLVSHTLRDAFKEVASNLGDEQNSQAEELQPSEPICVVTMPYTSTFLTKIKKSDLKSAAKDDNELEGSTPSSSLNMR